MFNVEVYDDSVKDNFVKFWLLIFNVWDICFLDIIVYLYVLRYIFRFVLVILIFISILDDFKFWNFSWKL